MNTNAKSCFRILLAFLCLTIGFSARALVIVPTFDASITNDPNAAVIESTINTAIQLYEARFSDPITVTILFQEITTSGLFGHSSWWYYNITYSQYRSALMADATTPNDTVALAQLVTGPVNPATGTGTMRVKTANLRAIGITGLNSGLSGGYDGIIGLHVAQLNLSRATNNPSKGDLLATVEHEMDEVLGLGSSLDSNGSDPFPEDLFRYTSAGARTFTTNGDNAYFSIDGANLLARFNQNPGGDFGDWWTAGAHTPQVQDAFATDGATPNPRTELIALDVIGYNLLPAPIPAITSSSVTGAQLVLAGTNGMAGGSYVVLTSTDLTTPRNQWTRIATNFLSNTGSFSFTVVNAVNPTEPQRFYTLELQ